MANQQELTRMSDAALLAHFAYIADTRLGMESISELEQAYEDIKEPEDTAERVADQVVETYTLLGAVDVPLFDIPGPGSGAQAIALRNDETREIFIAVRGTDNTLTDLAITDFGEMAFNSGIVDQHINPVLDLIDQVLAEHGGPDFQFTIVGHSLGAHVASIIAAGHPNAAEAITFHQPGFGGAVAELNDGEFGLADAAVMVGQSLAARFFPPLALLGPAGDIVFAGGFDAFVDDHLHQLSDVTGGRLSYDLMRSHPFLERDDGSRVWAVPNVANIAPVEGLNLINEFGIPVGTTHYSVELNLPAEDILMQHHGLPMLANVLAANAAIANGAEIPKHIVDSLPGRDLYAQMPGYIQRQTVTEEGPTRVVSEPGSDWFIYDPSDSAQQRALQSRNFNFFGLSYEELQQQENRLQEAITAVAGEDAWRAFQAYRGGETAWPRDRTALFGQLLAQNEASLGSDTVLRVYEGLADPNFLNREERNSIPNDLRDIVTNFHGEDAVRPGLDPRYAPSGAPAGGANPADGTQPSDAGAPGAAQAPSQTDAGNNGPSGRHPLHQSPINPPPMSQDGGQTAPAERAGSPTAPPASADTAPAQPAPPGGHPAPVEPSGTAPTSPVAAPDGPQAGEAETDPVARREAQLAGISTGYTHPTSQPSATSAAAAPAAASAATPFQSSPSPLTSASRTSAPLAAMSPAFASTAAASRAAPITATPTQADPATASSGQNRGLDVENSAAASETSTPSRLPIGIAETDPVARHHARMTEMGRAYNHPTSGASAGQSRPAGESGQRGHGGQSGATGLGTAPPPMPAVDVVATSLSQARATPNRQSRNETLLTPFDSPMERRENAFAGLADSFRARAEARDSADRRARS